MNFLKEAATWQLLAQLLVLHLVFPFFLAAFLRKYDRLREVKIVELLGWSVALTPALVTLLLYYLLWLVPGQAPVFYVGAVSFVFIAMGALALAPLLETVGYLRTEVCRLVRRYPYPTLALATVALGIVGGWLFYLNHKTLTEHDTLEYAVQGKIFLRDLAIRYEAHRYDEATGFYYVGLHGFAFPLLATWEGMISSITGVTSDLYFRSVNSVYGGLLLAFTFYYLRQLHYRLALWGTAGLLLTYGFFETLMKYHIDNFRVTFFFLATLVLYRLLQRYSVFLLLCFTLFAGAQAVAHSLGAMLVFFQLAVLLFFVEGNVKQKTMRAVLAGALILAFGAVHYVMDVITGTGWIFQELKFY